MVLPPVSALSELCVKLCQEDSSPLSSSLFGRWSLRRRNSSEEVDMVPYLVLFLEFTFSRSRKRNSRNAGTRTDREALEHFFLLCPGLAQEQIEKRPIFSSAFLLVLEQFFCYPYLLRPQEWGANANIDLYPTCTQAPEISIR